MSPAHWVCVCCFSGTAGSGEGVQQPLSLRDRPTARGGDLWSCCFDQIQYFLKKDCVNCVTLFFLPVTVEWGWQVFSTLSIMAQEVSSTWGRGRVGDDGRLHGNTACRLSNALHVHAALYEFDAQETSPAWRCFTKYNTNVLQKSLLLCNFSFFLSVCLSFSLLVLTD